MKTYGHDDGCDGRHTPRQRCNTRAQHDAPAVAVVAPDPLPVRTQELGRAVWPAGEAGATRIAAGEQREVDALCAETAIAVELRKAEQREPCAEARDAAAVRPAPDMAAAETLSRRAVADGPLDTIDTRGLPIAPVAGVAALGIACGVVAWRVLFARRR